jgi:hypothetical protein
MFSMRWLESFGSEGLGWISLRFVRRHALGPGSPGRGRFRCLAQAYALSGSFAH